MKIQGYFSTIKNADMAVNKLKNLGFSNTYRDINDHVGLNNSTESSIPGTENAPSLAGVVLNSGEPINYQDKATLAAASPMVSGMGGFEEIADINYKVVVDASSDDAENIKRIIEEAGGDIEDPNLNLPEHIKGLSKDIDYSDLDL